MEFFITLKFFALTATEEPKGPEDADEPGTGWNYYCVVA
ncbi:hypothetical protein PIIN_07385 [Serendipita indica DSM 11827]|uniref:Uncharacterized protein n=1 Tax=Serendipita indica (strain DSM 11827) TaxID=1109443 RepID=G4TQ36_SERID|nr:hypothetical protein PIIN_07385 [Serendipita indica DSM 11827]